eukprot:1843143-Rhodomonas_salina.2
MRERESVNTTALAVRGNVRSSSRRAAASGRRELTSPSIGSATTSTGELSTVAASAGTLTAPAPIAPEFRSALPSVAVASHSDHQVA